MSSLSFQTVVKAPASECTNEWLGWGALAYESQTIHHLYQEALDEFNRCRNKRKMRPDHALLLMLFHSDHDQLGLTNAYNNPATYLTAEEITLLFNKNEISQEKMCAFTTALAERAQKELHHAHREISKHYNEQSFRNYTKQIIDFSFKAHAVPLPTGFDALYQGTTTQLILLAYMYIQTINSPGADPSQGILKAPAVQAKEDIISPNYLQPLTSFIIDHRFYGEFPPELHRGHCFVKHEECPSSDCMETAIRDFLNILLYNPAKGKFDFSNLPPESQKTLDARCASFYSDDYPTTEYIDTCKAHQKWFALLSGRQDLDYVHQGRELIPTEKNFLIIMEQLLGIHSNSIRTLAERLQSSTQTLIRTEHKTVEHEDTIKEQIFYFTCYTTHSTSYSFELHMIATKPDWHAWIIFPERTAAAHKFYDLFQQLIPRVALEHQGNDLPCPATDEH